MPQRRISLTKEKIKTAFALFNNGASTSTVATALSCSLRTAQRLKDKSIPDEVTEPQSSHYSPQKRGPKHNPHREAERSERVKAVLTQEPDCAQEDIMEKAGMSLSQPSISRVIKKMGWSKKKLQRVPVERNSEANTNRRRAYASEIYQLSNQQLVFIDETGHNLHMTCNRGYSPLGQPAICQVPANRGRNFSAIVAITVTGVNHFSVIEGAVNEEKFLSFLGELNISQDQVLVMDNVRFHHGSLVSQWAATHNHRILYLPPYSPQLNPIEEFFHMHKLKVRRLNRPMTASRQVLKSRIVESLHSFRNFNLERFYSHMREYVGLAASGDRF